MRVYDPRGFEFEITVPNLLYILENTNSIKGKGLEGEFVYGWDGKDLVLIPTESPDYIEITDFNKLLHAKNNIKVKDLKLGATYLTKSNEEWVYMGKFDYHTTESEWDDKKRNYIRYDVNKGKYHFFVRESTYSWNNEKYLNIITLKSLGNRFINVVSEECAENFAYLMDKLECSTSYSPIDESKDEYVDYTFEDFKAKAEKEYWSIIFYTDDQGNQKKIHYGKRQDYTQGLHEEIEEEYEENNGWRTVTRTRYSKKPYESLEEVFNLFQPKYKNTYLANGKLHSEGK